MRRALVLLATAASVLAACTPTHGEREFGAGTAPTEARVPLGASGTPATFAWIDGSPAQVFRARVTADRDQTVVRTAFAVGSDQGKVIVFDDDGSRALDFALPFATPFPASSGDSGVLRQAMIASGDQVVPFVAGGRRLLLVGTEGRHAPSALLLIEFDASGRSRELLTFWNDGSIRQVCVSETHVGFSGVNNALDRGALRRDLGEAYATVAAVFRIPPPGASATRGQSPRGEVGAFDEGNGYDTYVRLPLRQIAGAELRRLPSIEGGAMRMQSPSGASIDVDLATGEVSAPAVESRDAGLVRVWRR